MGSIGARAIAQLCAAAMFVSSGVAWSEQVPQQPPAATDSATIAPAAPAMTAADIEAFLDGLVPLQIETNDIAGATIAIVKDGKLLFAKGYGFSDVETRKPVSPETTLFRTGSVTKLFTWTSVMQLVEQGKLDLDADVNTYLDFKIPHTHGKPVTLRNLLTHRGGFQETLKNLGAQSSGSVDLGKYVRENIPDQIFEPGSTPSYSHYGASLAGYIVERVSGVPFDKYVDDNIFKPLGMVHSTLSTPLPKAFEADMSKGYVLASGGARDFEIVNGYPAGSQSASAIDISKFMLAFLNGGGLNDQRILKPETVQLMHNTITAYDERQNGIALGFYEESRNNLKIVGHGGDTVYFHSDLHLVPSQSLGFFVSYNSAGRGDTPPRSPLWGKFLDRYFPIVVTPHPAAPAGLSAKDVEGSYLTSRRADTSLLKLLTELGQLEVTANADDSITVDGLTGLNGQPRKWVAEGNGVFREKDKNARLVFKEGPDGVMRMLASSAGVQIFERAKPLRNGKMLQLIFAGSSVVLLLNVLLFPLAGAVRWHYAIDQGWTIFERAVRLLTMASIVTLFAFVGGMAGTLLTTISDSPWALGSELDAGLRMFQQIGWVALAGIAVVTLNFFVALRSPVRGNLGRIKETIVLVSYGALLWFAWTMNMFDPALKF